MPQSTDYRCAEDDERDRQSRKIALALFIVVIVSALANVALNEWGAHLTKQRCIDKANALGGQWGCYGKEVAPGVWKYTVENDSPLR